MVATLFVGVKGGFTTACVPRGWPHYHLFPYRNTSLKCIKYTTSRSWTTLPKALYYLGVPMVTINLDLHIMISGQGNTALEAKDLDTIRLRPSLFPALNHYQLRHCSRRSLGGTNMKRATAKVTRH
ncbi:hypothetical protein FRB94_007309 [Tulasnella sp. JGI-2019a]|nr:hypothetical protein FRB94_007309 [Tulasnella sp. JGI-2019a]